MRTMDLLQVSLLVNKQTGGEKNEEKGKRMGKESNTCELRVPKARQVQILTGGFLLC